MERESPDMARHPTVRRSLLIGMLAGFAAFLLASVIEWQSPSGTPYDRFVYPAFSLVMTLLWLVIWRVPHSLRFTVTVMSLGLVAFFSTKVAYLLLSPQQDVLTELSETAYWIPGVYVIAVTFPASDLARRAAMGLALFVGLLCLGYAAFSPLEWYGLRHVVAQIGLSNLGIAVMTYGFTATKDSLATSQAEAEAERRLARTDPLTGLPNRLACEEALEAAVLQEDSFGVVFVDLDRFKAVNDTYGHDAGDDLLARISGDEFVLLLHHVRNDADALAAVERVRTGFAEPFDLGEASVKASASLGYCLYPEHGGDAATLLKRADEAMYRVKGSGRDGVGGADAPPLPSAQEAAQLGQLSLHYQPIYDLNTNRPLAAEALLRWQHPERGPLKGHGALNLLEHDEAAEVFILGAACRQMAAWRREGYAVDAVTVNISSRMFAREGFYDTVERALVAASLEPGCLILELTECAFGDEARTQRVLDRLRALGVKTALANFGRLSSSLLILGHVAVDFVKLDRGVVTSLTSLLEKPHETLSLVQGVLAAAEVLDVPVIAEGVETSGQLARVRNLGITLAQGNLFSPPVPASELSAPEVRGVHPGALN